MPSQELQQLRKVMKENKLQAFLIPNSDPHQSEYLPEHWRLMPWLTGFDGSAGNVVVTQDFAGVWTDSRYFIQAAEQLADSGFELMKLKVPHTPEYIEWITQNLGEGDKVGVDPRLISAAQAQRLQSSLKKGHIALTPAPGMLNSLWENRPELPQTDIIAHPLMYAGLDRREKIANLRTAMDNKQSAWYLVTALDELAWLFNLRGSDIDYNPVFVAFAVVGHQDVILFIDPIKVPEKLKLELEADGVIIKPYDQLDDFLGEIPHEETLYFTPSQASWHLTTQWSESQPIAKGDSLIADPKARKNHTEIKSLRQVMIRDGVAMVKFLHWLENEVPGGEVTEVSAAAKLEEFRGEQPNFVGPSFGTIAGFKGNGAIVHYSAKEDTCATLSAEGLFLLDSGGQYLDGTTDITRTIALGKPTPQERRDYTLVLKGNIALDQAVFPQGTAGHQLDILARHPLWKSHQNYGHGTGHGVGFFLNVHEGPQRISPSASATHPLQPGMVTSNEPGIYHEGAYGIRIENLILCVKAGTHDTFGEFLEFETLTLCPLDLKLIDSNLLTATEKDWINQYHRLTFEAISPHLSPSELEWLENQTQPI